MKKDKEWVQKEVDRYLSYEGVNEARNALVFAKGVIDQLDEPEKPIIPQFVAEAFEKAKGDNCFTSQLINAMYESSDEVAYWLEVPSNEKLLLRAWLNGYEIEKEKLYYIKFSESQYAQKFDGTKIDSILANDKAIAGKFTKEEIEKMNSNFMALAVEVAE